MFGKQAIRLLREAWGGRISPGSDGELREKGAKQLAEELYAMFDSDIPLEHDGPITINKGSNAAPLTINNNFGNNVIDPPTVLPGNFGPSFAGDSFIVNGGNTTITGGDVTVAGNTISSNSDDTTAAGDTLTLDFGAITITVGDLGPMSLADYIALIAGGGGSSTSVFLGRVVSGSGSTYQVALYGNGSAAPPTATVTATVPQIDADEAVPPDTWIAAVHKFTVDSVVTYEFQPPVWM